VKREKREKALEKGKEQKENVFEKFFYFFVDRFYSTYFLQLWKICINMEENRKIWKYFMRNHIKSSKISIRKAFLEIYLKKKRILIEKPSGF
jgi:hypothetical protein